jgi:Tfp pilus assembly protein PilF
MKAGPRLLALHVCIYGLPLWALAQGLGPTGANILNNGSDMVQGIWIVAGHVKTAQGAPVRGASVTVSPVTAAGPRNLTTDAQGEFRTEYQSVIGAVSGGFSVILTVKKKPFLTAHAYANYGSSNRTWVIPLTLRESEEDPDMLSSQDLIAALAPRLRQLGPEQGLPTKSEKDYTRAVAFLLEQHNPERAVPLLWKVAENNPSCVGCRMMLGLAQLSWCDWDDADRTIAESVNATIANRNLGRPEPLLAYGTKLNWQHQPEKAEPYFVEALKFAPQDALTLQELGRTLLARQKFGAANDALRQALAAGAGPEARLLYAESWLGAGQPDEAEAELKRYLNGRDVRNLPPRVRHLWANIQDRKKAEALYAKTETQQGQPVIDLVQHPPTELIQGLEPAADQQQLNCILDGVGARILEMAREFPNTSSLEEIHQEKLGSKGAIKNTQEQRFRYLCMVPHGAGTPELVEYRADFDGHEASPKGLSDGFMLTNGFASTELLFHPTYRAESTFRYLGRQLIHDRAAYVVAFAQIPGKARFCGKFRRGQTLVTTLSQGLAWIDPATYQIVRLHTELLNPVPELRLDGEAMNIDFNAVHFKNAQESFWLPEEVTVTLNWNGRVLRNRHKYSDFKLFSVDASEKIGTPKGGAEPSLGAEAPAARP